MDDGSFWAKLWNKVKYVFTGTVKPEKRLRSVLWSPFKEDKLYPFVDDFGDMVAFSREYKKKDLDDNEYTCFMTITKDSVYRWESLTGWQEKEPIKHGFTKLPVMYSYRGEAYCNKVRTFRGRREKGSVAEGEGIDDKGVP